MGSFWPSVVGFGLRSLDEILAIWDRDAFEVRARSIQALNIRGEYWVVARNLDLNICLNTTHASAVEYGAPQAPFVDVSFGDDVEWSTIYSGPDAWAVFGLAMWVLGCNVTEPVV